MPTVARIAEPKPPEILDSGISTVIGPNGLAHNIGADPSKILAIQGNLMANRVTTIMASLITLSKPGLLKSIPALVPMELGLKQHKEILKVLKLPSDEVKEPSYIKPSYDEIPSPESQGLIKAVGFEIEGSWNNPIVDFRIVGDGSVNSNGYPGSAPIVATGEVRMGPYSNGVIDVAEVVRCYPQYVNYSCGLHVHLSFPNKGIYNSFMNKAFYKWFIDGLKDWRTKAEAAGAPRYETFWRRITGTEETWARLPNTRGGRNLDDGTPRTNYCRVYYQPDWVASQTHGSYDHRYNAINYCFGKHGTIEVRVLNAWNTAEECIAAVREVIRLFRLWGGQNSTIPMNAALTGNEQALIGPDLPSLFRVVDFPDDLRYTVIHPSIRIPEAAIRASSASCSTCSGQGFRRYDCNCLEWCSSCQPVRYQLQGVKHDNGPNCWRRHGISQHWYIGNINCGVPQNFVYYDRLTGHRPSSLCPICNNPASQHSSRPTSSCPMASSEDCWIAYHIAS